MPENEPTEAPQEEPTAQRVTTIDAAADLLQMVVDFLRQETEGLVREKVVMPTQQAGMVVAFALAAAAVLALGVAFIAVAALLVLADWLGWPLALLVVGLVLIAGAAGFSAAKVRRMQK